MGLAVSSLRGAGRPTEHQQQLGELLADPYDGRDQEIVLGHYGETPCHTGADSEVIRVEDRRKQRGEQCFGRPCSSMQPVGVKVHITPHTADDAVADSRSEA